MNRARITNVFPSPVSRFFNFRLQTNPFIDMLE